MHFNSKQVFKTFSHFIRLIVFVMIQKEVLAVGSRLCGWSFFALFQSMESGRNGPLGACVPSHVAEAKAREPGHAHLPSMEEGPVRGPRLITSLVILPSVQVSIFGNWWSVHSCIPHIVPGVHGLHKTYNSFWALLESVSSHSCLLSEWKKVIYLFPMFVVMWLDLCGTN